MDLPFEKEATFKKSTLRRKLLANVLQIQILYNGHFYGLNFTTAINMNLGEKEMIFYTIN